jgi:putative membrane protein
MIYTNYFWGMHYGWWVIWALMLFWIFIIPYNIPGQRYKPDSPFDILRKRLAAGQITIAQYEEMKKTLEN